jgi:hypothetical protein
MKVKSPMWKIVSLFVLLGLSAGCSSDDKPPPDLRRGVDSGSGAPDGGAQDVGSDTTTPTDVTLTPDAPDIQISTPGFMHGTWDLNDGTGDIVTFELWHEEGSPNIRGNFQMTGNETAGQLGVTTWRDERFSATWKIEIEGSPIENWSYVGAMKRDDDNLVGNLTAGLGGAVSTAALKRRTE